MPTPTIPAGNLFMNATLWAGNGTLPRTIINGPAGASFQPDFVWMKDRTVAYYHQTYDSVRGTSTGGGVLYPNTTDAVDNTYLLNSFNSNGITLGTNLSAVNANGSNIVGWMWKAGGTAVSNTSGTITSQVSANTTSGFSVVTYTGNGVAGATVGHGLGVAPSMIIAKKRSSTGSWQVYASAVSGMAGGYLTLNGTSGFTGGNSTIWNNTAPTSSVFSLGTDTDANANGATNVAYCWAPIAGYSAFGSYTGNGSADGPFVYLGFRPKYMMIKRTDTADSWVIMDTSRNPYNAVNLWLQAESSGSESTLGTPQFDFVSNGMKLRGSSSTDNASGGTYIYMAFAENPFKYANAR